MSEPARNWLFFILVFVASPAAALSNNERAGLRLFLNETFDGNGRTCATCHRLERNFTIDPEFIANLPADDPLFVSEVVPELAGLENDVLVRSFALFATSPDPLRPNFRSTNHLNAVQTTIDHPGGPRLGWAGVSEGDGSLLHFTNGAIRQHFPRRLNRIEGVDFRLATQAEETALAAFQEFLGRSTTPALPVPLTDPLAQLGQEVFLDDNRGKCNLCHLNGGADRSGPGGGNENFDTGTESLSLEIAVETGQVIPTDTGPGDGTFNTAPLIEAADTPPYFHNNGAATLRQAMAFYGSAQFAASPAGIAFGPPVVNAQERDGLIAFLIILNAIQNLDEALLYFQESINEAADREISDALLTMVRTQVRDAIDVLDSEGLHSDARSTLNRAANLLDSTSTISEISSNRRNRIFSRLQSARALMIDESAPDPTGTLSLTGVTPGQVSAGRVHELTVTGTGFTPGVRFAACPRQIDVHETAFVNPTTLTATISVGQNASGSCNAQVTNRDTGERSRLNQALTIAN